jgi:hypothetical protein
MDLEKYFETFPEAKHRRDWLDAPPRCDELRHGVIIFNEETACCWGGPFEGNAAAYIISDNRLSPYFNKNGRCTLPTQQELAESSLRRINKRLREIGVYNSSSVMRGIHKERAKSHKKRRKYFESLRDRIKDGDVQALMQYNEIEFMEYPFRIFCYGNDDTSWSKWFPTKEEAFEIIDMLEACEPVDMFDDFHPFDWVFTN